MLDCCVDEYEHSDRERACYVGIIIGPTSSGWKIDTLLSQPLIPAYQITTDASKIQGGAPYTICARLMSAYQIQASSLNPCFLYISLDSHCSPNIARGV